MSLINLTPAQLRQAADLKEKIVGLEKQLAAISPGSGIPAPLTVSKPAKRKISAAHIAKIRAAQKLRWAKVNATKAKPVAAPTAKPAKKKFVMSAAAKAKLSALAKARWAKIKGAKPANKPVAKKKGTISAEGIARIKAAQKARWAKIHAEKAAKK